jgi:hypothetical protein
LRVYIKQEVNRFVLPSTPSVLKDPLAENVELNAYVVSYEVRVNVIGYVGAVEPINDAPRGAVTRQE